MIRQQVLLTAKNMITDNCQSCGKYHDRHMWDKQILLSSATLSELETYCLKENGNLEIIFYITAEN